MKKVLLFTIILVILGTFINAVIIDGEVSYNSTDNNVTQETGFAHLTLNATNVILYMPFNVNTTNTTLGNTTFDYTTNNNDGRVDGAIWNSTGGFDNLGAYEFDGIDDMINGTLVNPIGFENFSISLWFKTAHDTTGSEFMWANGGGGGPIDSELFMASNGGIRSRIDGQTIISTSGFDDQLWHQAIFVADRGGNGQMFVDGVVSGAAVDISGQNDNVSRTTFFIGNRISGTNAFNGSIDEVMIFNRTLNTTEVAEMYANATSRFSMRGTMLFENVSTNRTTTVNITLNDCQTPFGSILSARINNLIETNFSNCTITNYNITDFQTEVGVNLTIFFQAGNLTNTFYTPLIIGNINFDTFGPETVAPVITNVNFTPSSPAPFNLSAIYNFTADITDISGVDVVLINFNGTNFTATLSGVNTYFFIRTNLTPDTYIFSWFANDTFGNFNTTEDFNYTVTGGDFDLSLTSSAGQILFSNTSTLITVVGCPSSVTCTLFDPDGVIRTSPFNFTMVFSGFFTFTANSTATANFSAQSASLKLEGLHRTDDGGKGNMTIAVTLMLIALTTIFLSMSFLTQKQHFTFGAESFKILFFSLGMFFLLGSVGAVRTMAVDLGLSNNLVGLLNIMYIALLWIVILITAITILIHIITAVNALKRSLQVKKDGDFIDEVSF